MKLPICVLTEITMKLGCTIIILLASAITCLPASGQETGVVWTHLHQATAIGNSLLKARPCGECIAGALSEQRIVAGDGMAQFTVTDPGLFLTAGLGNPDTLAGPDDLAYALTINNQMVEVREAGEFLWDMPVANGDTLRIAIESGIINYYRNDERFYTSEREPDYPLVFAAALGDLMAEVSNALISDSEGVLWNELVNAEVSGKDLVKNAGCDGCTDSIAVAQQAIHTGEGSVEFVVGSLDEFYVGLHGTVAPGDTPSQFGLYVGGGTARTAAAGSIPAQVPASVGDTFTIAIEKGQVVYYRNGGYFFTAAERLSYPYTAHAMLMGAESVISSARMSGVAVLDRHKVPTEEILSDWQTQPACGLNSSSIYPPVDYSMTPPARGESFLDPVFGCTITRLSDGMSQFNFNVRHQYSSISPFNADNSLILLEAGNGRAFIVDLQGNVVVSPEELNITSGDEPVWSVQEPTVLIYHRYQSNTIMLFEVSSRTHMPVYAFPEYASISFGGGEGDLSDDGNHIIVIGDNRYVQVFEGSTRKAGKVFDTAGRPFDWFDMTADNNVLVMWHAAGTGRYQGLELYDEDMNFIRQVAPYVGHADRGRDMDGEEIIVMMSANDREPLPECEGSGVVKIRLRDSEETCLMRLIWGQSGHISVNNSGGHPWALISNTEYFSGTAKPDAELPPDWTGRWGAHFNELALARLDGSRIIRLAHHRSRVQDDYIHMPRAAISRDGRYVLFDSNFAQQPTSQYTDVYLLDTGITPRPVQRANAPPAAP